MAEEENELFKPETLTKWMKKLRKREELKKSQNYRNLNMAEIGAKILFGTLKKKELRKFVVRLYDGFDNEWMDVSGKLSKEEADKIWNEHTENGAKNTKFDDIDYYAIFPAFTKMLFSSGVKYE